MALSKSFDHQAAEKKWYQHWIDHGYFHSRPDQREPYTIVMPPPNVTGVLHMGHCLNNTIQDILIRRARMQGKNACWVPGTDHASIATEAKVVQMLRERGISKSSLSRDEFLKYAWEWKEKYGGIILQQLRKLGCSADWERTTFTMDPHYYDSVINVFIDLYNKGYIYRGKRMINWDPRAKTALSDEEVIRREVQSKLYYVRYAIEGSNETVTIATVRPETILGDTAIAVHPGDERYRHLHGRYAFVPLINRRIPIITDDYVSMDFGTGALKVTPAHDKNDYNLAQSHGLEIIDIFNDDGTLNENAIILIGLDRFEARKKILPLLEAAGHIAKIEDYTNNIGFSERTDVVVEDRLSLQWWVDMKKLYAPALEAVMDDRIKFHPAKFRNLYRNWMENIRDWCISRQLWWGQRIPAWYDDKGNVYIAKTREEAAAQMAAKHSNVEEHANMIQDDDVMDTWFSAWLWPIEVFKGISDPSNADIKYYYPTNTLVTAPEIIFFWVARMIVSGFEYKHQEPFRDVYFTGIVRDKLGRKMSKQLGNSPDLLGLIDKYGADAVRFGIMIASPAGNDLLWDEASNEQGAFFANKMWNALKLVKLWEEKRHPGKPRVEQDFAVTWMENRLNEVCRQVENSYTDFRLSEALKTIYSLIWDDFCSWYLEWVKPAYGEPVDSDVYDKTVSYFESLMQLLHPFMPFITEEIYHELKPRSDTDDITISALVEPKTSDNNILEQGILLKELITGLRDGRNKLQLKPRDPIQLLIQTDEPGLVSSLLPILAKQVNSETCTFVNEAQPGSLAMVIGKHKFYLVAEQKVDTEGQRETLLKELEYLRGFLLSVDRKLSNERFVQNAKPDVVAIERKKKEDAEAKIRIIEESLAAL